MKAEWLDRALFTSPVHYTLCTSERMFHAELRACALPRSKWPPFLLTSHAHATINYIEHHNGRQMAIVCMPPAPERDQLEVVGLLVHEAVHLWQWIREYIGEKAPSMEFEAYAVQRIVQSLLGEYRRQVYGGPR